MNVSIFNILQDGHVVFCGTGGEVQRQFGLSANTRVSEYALYGKKINKKYDVEYAEKGDLRVEYDFYEKGEWVFRGTNKEFKDHFNVQFTGSVASYARSNSLILGRFRAYHAEAKQDKRLDYLATHLEKYGNTVSKKDPAQYIEALKEQGINCTIRKCVARDAKRRKDVYYIIERC